MNWKVVEQRRIAAGPTRTELVQRVGASAVTGRSRLWRDEDHDRVPLGQLERLCAVLDLRPAELFASRRRTSSGARLDPDAVDAAIIEAALTALAAARSAHQHLPTGGPIARADLASALGWRLTRLDNALHALDERLTASGTRLDVDPDGAIHGLRPRDGLLSVDQRERLHRLCAADLALSRAAARALYAIAVHGYRLYGEDTQDASAPAMERQQRGLAQRRRNTTNLDPSPEGRAALLLAEPPPSGR